MSIPTRIRPITIDDLSRVSDIHRAAFPDSVLTHFGDEVVQRYYLWQLTGPHQVVALGYDYEYVLVGFCFAGVFRGAMSGFLRKYRTYIVWRLLTHPWLLLDSRVREQSIFGLRLVRGKKRTNTHDIAKQENVHRYFGILSIAVIPTNQGQGIGKRLMEDIEVQAINKGYSLMRLSVDKDNLQAISFYESIGWEKEMVDDQWDERMVKSIR